MERVIAWVAGLGQRVRVLAGWRRYALALALGIISAAADAPFFIWPVLVPAFTGLVWLLDGSSNARRPGRAALALGWWFGFGQFVLGFYWIMLSLLTDPERFAWLVPFTLLGVPGGLAIFTAIATWLAWRLHARGALRIFVLAAAWTLLEILRGHVLTGFPWNLVGYVWADSPAMLQVASLTGAYGLTLWTVLVAAWPALIADTDAPPKRRVFSVLGVLILAPALIWAGGEARLASLPTAGTDAVPGIRLRLVQPAIAQQLKWLEDQRLANARTHLAMTVTPGFEQVTHVIWPETAMSYFLDHEPELRQAIAAVTPKGGAVLTGTLRAEPRTETTPFRVWNSFQGIDPKGNVVVSYDKFHLVPFGEYVPLRWLLPIDKITPGMTDFSAGPGPRTLEVPGAPPVSPLICYEAIFPGAVTEDGKRPGWLLNVTNDAWFGESAGPYQHFFSARVRAVEEGLPLVRAANTGISAVIDPYGRIVGRLGLGQRGVLDAPLPAALAPTLFSRTGSWPVIAIVLLILITSPALSRRR
ncbi:MAG: apolipoprotein N-acyltransferase [Alphaproteobacteria bacterium]|nr:apolipoprotein N-acyltransferase [Alphaproteobacteria bacterium]